MPITALLVSQLSKLIYKDKFSIIKSSYECGFSNNINNINYYNKLNSVVPKFIVLEIILMLIIVLYYFFNNKIIIDILLFILSGLSIYFSKSLTL